MEKIITEPLGWEQNQLDLWNKEHDLTFPSYFEGYVNFDDSTTLGKIYYRCHPSGEYNQIVIKNKFVGRSLATKAILWHEFCHHRDCIENACHDHCTKYFKKYLWEKPLLALIDAFLPA